LRVESSVTAITWLPFAALDALPELPLGLAVAHYDEPPPERIRDLDGLRKADAFREANELRAWIDVDEGEIVAFGRGGAGFVADVSLDAVEQVAFPAVEFPVLRPEPEAGDGWVRFAQTVGGRIGMPVPRRLRGKAYLHIGSALAWTTVELVLHADSRADARLVAASPFPRHSVYDGDGRLVEEHGSIDPGAWAGEPGADATPWSAGAAAGAVEAQVDEELTRVVLGGGGVRLERRRLRRGDALVEQGEAGEEMFLLLDGILDVEVDGETVAQVGAGALLGELAVLGAGRRTATLRAARPCRVAVLAAHQVEGSRLAHLALESRRSSAPSGSG
jgi:cyclic nucleotide-binding protein